MLKGLSIDEFLHKKRWAKRQRQNYRATRERERKKVQAQSFERLFGDRSRIIGLFVQQDVKKKLLPKKPQSLKIHIPQTFSIIRNPEFVLQTIRLFATEIRRNRITTVTFDHGDLENYELAAESLLDLIADELRIEQRKLRRKTRFKGRYPRDPHARRFLRAVGIIKHLEIMAEALDDEESKKLRTFFRRKKHYAPPRNPEKADDKSIVIGRFVDHINGCLSDNGKALTTEGKQRLGEYVGEILSNAEEHSGMTDWTIEGYLDNSLSIPMCEIALFNFGRTIADSLLSLPKSSYTRKQIAPYLDMHHSRRLFSHGWREEDLVTLVALQGHVSSKNESDLDTRGQGTVDLIDFFQKVHKECADKDSAAEMAILSGNTHILFDGSYVMIGDNQGRKRIAFNQDNDLYKKPDSKYVRSLGSLHFPGTIISIRFPFASKRFVSNEVDHDQ